MKRQSTFILWKSCLLLLSWHERFFGFFNGISTFVGYLLPNTLVVLLDRYLWVDKTVHSFSERINTKGNVLKQLKFELAYYDVTVKHVSHYATRTLLNITEFFFFLETWCCELILHSLYTEIHSAPPYIYIYIYIQKWVAYLWSATLSFCWWLNRLVIIRNCIRFEYMLSHLFGLEWIYRFLKK